MRIIYTTRVDTWRQLMFLLNWLRGCHKEIIKEKCLRVLLEAIWKLVILNKLLKLPVNSYVKIYYLLFPYSKIRFIQEKSCKSEAHFASFHSLSAEIYRIGSDTEKELFHLQQTIKSHPINVDLWLRIAECYGRKSGIDIYSNVFQLTKTKSASWFAAASLVRVEIILKSVAGKDEVGLLKKKRNQKLKNLVKPVIESLPPNFVSIAHEVISKALLILPWGYQWCFCIRLQALSRDVYNLEPPTQDDSEFVDLGSSKLTQTLEGQDKDSSHSLESGNQQDSFEKVWFNFADSIQDINLYYIPSENTHECDA